MLLFCTPVLAGPPAAKVRPAKPKVFKIKEIRDGVNFIQVNHIVDRNGVLTASFVLFWSKFKIDGKWEPRIIAWKHTEMVAFKQKGKIYQVEWMDNGIKRIVESNVFEIIATPFDIEVRHRNENGNYPLRGLTTPYEASLVRL